MSRYVSYFAVRFILHPNRQDGCKTTYVPVIVFLSWFYPNEYEWNRRHASPLTNHIVEFALIISDP